MSNQLTQKTTHDSGLTTLTGYVPAEATAYYHVAVRIGSGSADDITNGEAHFLEHMAFNGVHKSGKPIDFKTLRQEREEKGIFLGAYTSQTHTEYSATVPVKLGITGVQDVVQEIARMVISPTLPEERIAHEKRVISNEWGSRFQDLQIYLLEQAYIKGFKSNSAFGHRILGERDTVQAITRDGLIDFIAGNYTTPNTEIAVSGPINHDEIVKINEAAFADMPKHDRAPHPEETPLEEDFSPEVMDFVPHNYFRILLPIPGFQSGFDTSTLELLRFTIYKRLSDNIRDKIGSTYGILTEFDQARTHGYFTIATNCAPHEVQGLVKDISRQLHSVAKDDIEGDLSVMRNMRQNGHSGNYGNAENMVANLSDQYFREGSVYDIESRLAAYSAVTTEQIRALTVQMLEGPINLVGLGKKGSFPPEAEFRDIMRLQEPAQTRTLRRDFTA